VKKNKIFCAKKGVEKLFKYMCWEDEMDEEKMLGLLIFDDLQRDRERLKSADDVDDFFYYYPLFNMKPEEIALADLILGDISKAKGERIFWHVFTYIPKIRIR